MADLEDFFAKRDKKKKKAPKFEAEDVAKILEKKRVDMSKSSYQPTAETSENVSEYKAQEDDDEWREAVEHKPDFSGLKIQDLVEENSEDEEKEAIAEAEAQKEGPWKRSNKGQEEPVAQPTQLTTPIVTPQVESSAEAEDSSETAAAIDEAIKEPAAKATEEPGKYVPIHMRNKVASTPAPSPTIPAAAPKPASSTPVEPVGKYVPAHRRPGAISSSSSSSTNRPKKSAPSIDDLNFPSLGEC